MMYLRDVVLAKQKISSLALSAVLAVASVLTWAPPASPEAKTIKHDSNKDGRLIIAHDEKGILKT